MRRRADDRADAGDAGFTLLEVLAAVAVAGFALSAIGGVVAVTLAGLRSAADRVTLTEAGRALLDGLPQGEALRPGTTTGTIGTTQWRIDVAQAGRGDPVRRLSDADAHAPSWSAAAIVITARTPRGRSLRLDTIGLIRSGGR